MKSFHVFTFSAALVLSLGSAPAQAQSLEQDSLALVAFYNATGGPDWTDNTGWLTGPVSTWFGVNLSSGRVRDIFLVNNNLTGSIPPEIGDISELAFLTLRQNFLSGEIPPEIGNLLNLKEISATDNQLSGSIPAELGLLPNLSLIQLSRNQLTGPIPAALGNLSELIALQVNDNALSGSIPPELGNLTKLTGISFNNTGLEGPIPDEFGNLINLTFLSVFNTLLSGTLPHSLVNLTSLATFFFANTDLCESLDPEFQVWLAGITTLQSSGCTNVANEAESGLPFTFELQTNYPNPFNPSTRIQYAIPSRSNVQLGVYDVQGRLIKTLVDANQPAGHYVVSFEAGNLPSGTYFYRLVAGDFTESRHMVLLK